MTTDNYRSISGMIQPRVPRAGKIRLGVKAKNANGKEYPKEVDYFVLDDDLPARAAIVEKYGAQPKRLLVTFASENPEDVFPIAYKAYVSGAGLFCRGNGQSALRLILKDGKPVVGRDGKKALQRVECTCAYLEPDERGARRCRPVGNLHVVLPEVGWSVYQIDTTSWHTMQNLRNDFTHYAGLLGGSIRGRLFWLDRHPTETHGSGRKETHYPLRLQMLTPEEYEAKIKSLGDFVGKYRSLLAAGNAVHESPAALPPGETTEREDDHILDSETVAPTDVDPAANPTGDAETGGAEPEKPKEAAKPQAAPTEPLATKEQTEEIRVLLNSVTATAGAAGLLPTDAPNPDVAARWWLTREKGLDMRPVFREMREGRFTRRGADGVIHDLKGILYALKDPAVPDDLADQAPWD